MIPVEVTLRNFMSFGEYEGEGYRFNFRDHRLWSISGDNGAGKSAIFDAITYTLFGRHRGGERRDEELIRKGANDLACAFSFEHHGRLYRVTRTIKRKVRRSGEVAYHRACQLDWHDEPNAAWREVSGCATVTGLEEYVRTDLLGFDYDTFISSVLLLQGDSDKLLRSKASDRFAYLSGILDLRRYARLEKVAWSRAKTFRDQSQVMGERLQELGIPSAEDVQKADDKASLLGIKAANSAVLLKAAEDRLGRVTLFWELSKRQEQYELKAKAMTEAQGHADQIRKESAEKRLLTEALPRLTDAVSLLTDADVASQAAEKALNQANAIDVDALATTVKDTDTKARSARLEHDSKVTEIKNARVTQRKLEPMVALARQLRDLDVSIDRATAQMVNIRTEIEPLDGLRRRLERLDLLHRTQPIIRSYAEARKRQAQLLAAFGEESPETAFASAQSARERVELEIETLRVAVADQKELIGSVRGELAVAEESLRQREEAGSEGRCSHCGQAVSPAHIRKEIANAKKELARLTAAATATEEQLNIRALHLTDRLAQLPALRELEQSIRDRIESLRQAASSAELTLAGFEEVPDDIRKELGGEPEVFDALVNGVAAELIGFVEVRTQVSALAAKEADLRSQISLVADWEAEKKVVLDRVTPAEADAALSQAANLDKYVAEAEIQEAALLRVCDASVAELEMARIAQGEALTKKAELTASANVHEATAAGRRGAAEIAISSLDARLLPPTKKHVDETKQRLKVLQHADEKLALLETAVRELDGLRGQISEVVEQVGKVADVDRIGLNGAAEAVGQARLVHAAIQEEERGARDYAVAIANQRQERLEMEKMSGVLAQQHRIWDRLAKLLSRGGIQLALMKRDLAEIERLANVTLGKISGGMLQLSIECIEGRGGEEIVFRCIDGASADDAFDVAFLSGGQKFRVAVALAVGIGQYSGLGGSMPSQIIDEGFGSLDEQGRIEMLDQIRAMSEHFERIIVVSHTDSFHDPALFPARYELHKVGRRTVVEAFV